MGMAARKIQQGKTRGVGSETRERILRAAMHMIEMHAADDIQLRDVADEAGVSAALIIRYFGSKTALVFEALMTRHCEVGNVVIETAIESGEICTLAELLHFLVRMDIANRNRTIDVMQMGWRRTPDQEAAYNATMATRTNAARAFIAREYPGLTGERLDQCVHLIAVLYAETLRVALIQSWSSERALDALLPVLTTFLSAAAAQAKA